MNSMIKHKIRTWRWWW